MVDGGMKTKGPGAMDADGLCPALLEVPTTVRHDGAKRRF
jgi:hypothetical protein